MQNLHTKHWFSLNILDSLNTYNLLKLKIHKYMNNVCEQVYLYIHEHKDLYLHIYELSRFRAAIQVFFFYMGFPLRTFTNSRVTVLQAEGDGISFPSSLPLSPASKTRRHQPGNYCREPTKRKLLNTKLSAQGCSRKILHHQ